jgi:hypothetical protein
MDRKQRPIHVTPTFNPGQLVQPPPNIVIEKRRPADHCSTLYLIDGKRLELIPFGQPENYNLRLELTKIFLAIS